MINVTRFRNRYDKLLNLKVSIEHEIMLFDDLRRDKDTGIAKKRSNLASLEKNAIARLNRTEKLLTQMRNDYESAYRAFLDHERMLIETEQLSDSITNRIYKVEEQMNDWHTKAILGGSSASVLRDWSKLHNELIKLHKHRDAADNKLIKLRKKGIQKLEPFNTFISEGSTIQQNDSYSGIMEIVRNAALEYKKPEKKSTKALPVITIETGPADIIRGSMPQSTDMVDTDNNPYTYQDGIRPALTNKSNPMDELLKMMSGDNENEK